MRITILFLVAGLSVFAAYTATSQEGDTPCNNDDLWDLIPWVDIVHVHDTSNMPDHGGDGSGGGEHVHADVYKEYTDETCHRGFYHTFFNRIHVVGVNSNTINALIPPPGVAEMDQAISELTPEEIAQLSPEAQNILELYPVENAVYGEEPGKYGPLSAEEIKELFNQLPPEEIALLFNQLPPEIALLFNQLSPQEIALLLEHLTPAEREPFLEDLIPELREQVEKILTQEVDAEEQEDISPVTDTESISFHVHKSNNTDSQTGGTTGTEQQQPEQQSNDPNENQNSSDNSGKMLKSNEGKAPAVVDEHGAVNRSQIQAEISQLLATDDYSLVTLHRLVYLHKLLTAESGPTQTELLANYPNPFNPETWIPYHLADPSDVTITIYDARGAVVRRLELGHQQEGYYTSRSRATYWDGRNDMGERVASGIYFYQLQADNVSRLRKMLILK